MHISVFGLGNTLVCQRRFTGVISIRVDDSVEVIHVYVKRLTASTDRHRNKKDHLKYNIHINY